MTTVQAESGIWRRGGLALLLVLLLMGEGLAAPAPAMPAAEAAPTLWPVVPSQAQMAAALDAAAAGRLPAGYPTLHGVPLVPGVLLKAIAWLESGWRQEVAPGVPLVSASGGYGVMQVTDAMAPGMQPLPLQAAIASNYIYNIAYGAQVLSDKWLATPAVGAHDPRVVEDWYYALWAFNAWGAANDPANPAFTRTGTPPSQPQTYPYQERILYLVSHPPLGDDRRPLWPAVAVAPPDQRAVQAADGGYLALSGPVHRVLPGVAGPLVPCVAGQTAPAVGDCTPRADGVAFLDDGAQPRGALPVAPGETVMRGWVLRNTGGTFWNSPAAGTAGYHLQRLGGAGGLASITLPEVPPLATVVVHAGSAAPRAAGTHTISWQMQDGRGRAFGPPASTRLLVEGTSPARSQPAATSNTPRLSRVGRARLRAEDALYVGDISVPDGTVVAPGQHFRKGWLYRNVGTSTWDPSYHLTFEAGAMLGPTTNVRSGVVPPGADGAFTVTLVAPSRPGLYRSIWQMTDWRGRPFGAQAWVSISVSRSASPTPAATATPAHTPTSPPAATDTPAPPDTPVPSPTRVPVPTSASTPRPTPTTGVDTSSSWLGPIASTAFFDEGYTGGHTREYMSLFNPGSLPAGVRFTLYRQGGATRVLSLVLPPFGLRSIDVGGLAPQSSVSVRLESDRPVAVERAMYMGTGGHVAAAAVPARHWSFVHWLVGSGYDEWLPLFNPGDQALLASVAVTRTGGSVRRFQVAVPARTRVTVRLARYLGGATSRGIAVDAPAPLLAEHIAYFHGGQSVLGHGGASAPSRVWYFAASRTDGGRTAYVPVANPGAEQATVTLTLLMNDGSWQEQYVIMAPHSTHVFAVHHLIHSAGISLIVRSTVPIYAEQCAYLANGRGGAISAGVSRAALAWSLAEGYSGAGFDESLVVLNPGDRPATVQVRYARSWGRTASRVVHVPARGRASWHVHDDVPPGNVAVALTSNVPVVVGRVEEFDSGWGITAAQAIPRQTP